MFDFRLVQKVCVLDGFAQCRAKDLLFDLSMDSELQADLIRQIMLILTCACGARLRQRFIVLEHGLDHAVVGVEQGARIGGERVEFGI